MVSYHFVELNVMDIVESDLCEVVLNVLVLISVVAEDDFQNTRRVLENDESGVVWDQLDHVLVDINLVDSHEVIKNASSKTKVNEIMVENHLVVVNFIKKRID